MIRLTPRFESEPYGEQRDAGRMNPAEDIRVNVEGRDLRLKSGHGQNDRVYVWVDGEGYLYVLSTNLGLGYAGLAQYDLGGVEEVLSPVAETFLDGDHEINEAVADGIEASPEDFLKAMREYF